MAYLITTDGKKLIISEQQGLFLWKKLNDPSDISHKLEDQLSKIEHLYLNYLNAPDDYIQKNISVIMPMLLNDWMCDRDGKLTRPGSSLAWRFAKKWGLWEFGKPSPAIYGGQLRWQMEQ